MSYEYKYVNGEVVSIEIMEEWENVLLELDRQEYNINHRETRRHVSLDTSLDKSYWNESDLLETAVRQDIHNLNNDQLNKAIKKLNDKQVELLEEVFINKRWFSEYAENEGVTKSAISHRFETIIKKIKKNI